MLVEADLVLLVPMLVKKTLIVRCQNHARLQEAAVNLVRLQEAAVKVERAREANKASVAKNLAATNAVVVNAQCPTLRLARLKSGSTLIVNGPISARVVIHSLQVMKIPLIIRLCLRPRLIRLHQAARRRLQAMKPSVLFPVMMMAHIMLPPVL